MTKKETEAVKLMLEYIHNQNKIQETKLKLQNLVNEFVLLKTFFPELVDVVFAIIVAENPQFKNNEFEKEVRKTNYKEVMQKYEKIIPANIKIFLDELEETNRLQKQIEIMKQYLREQGLSEEEIEKIGKGNPPGSLEDDAEEWGPLN